MIISELPLFANVDLAIPPDVDQYVRAGMAYLDAYVRTNPWSTGIGLSGLVWVAKKTKNTWDDRFVAWLTKRLPVKPAIK